MKEVTMYSGDPLATLAHDRRGRLQAEAEAERLRTPSPTRHALAAFLRRAADRLEPQPIAPRPALR
jgi:hypothetical protein